MTDDQAPPDSSRQNALERLRDRTDELELIISSLTIFALLSLPSWLFEHFSLVFTHLSVGFLISGVLTISLVTGICYGLAACFIVHLMTRAYWVGLIGLRTVFPNGIDWKRLPGIGPLTKAYYQRILPDQDTVIQQADRLASSLFAVISMLTLSTLWIGVIIFVIVVLSGVIGARFGLTNTAIGIATIVMLAVMAGPQVIQWLLDRQLARRVPRLQEHAGLKRTIRAIARFNGIIFPQRLVLPVQFTLQSNTRPVLFYLALLASMVAIVMIGNTRFAGWQQFSLSGQFTYLDDDDVADGFRSTFYEDMRTVEDRLRAWPSVDSFVQKGGFVRLFLPYQPVRDNLILDTLCADRSDDTPPGDCLRRLWAVSIGDRQVPIENFATAERMDLHMRGLIGLVPLMGLEPGLHRIDVVWNVNAEEGSEPIDDRYAEIRRTYSIPIAFSPDVERALE